MPESTMRVVITPTRDHFHFRDDANQAESIARLTREALTSLSTVPTVTVEPGIGSRRTTWLSAAPLHRAADQLRAVAPDITGTLAGLAGPVADWLDETANTLSWLAPYHPGEPGYGMWQAATRIAEAINGPAAVPGSAGGDR